MFFMHLFHKKYNKAKFVEAHPLEFDAKSNKETNVSLKKIEENKNEWSNEAISKGIDTMLVNIPDIIVHDIINRVVFNVNQENDETIKRLIDDIDEENSVDSSDLLVTLKLIDKKNKIKNRIQGFSSKAILSKNDKMTVMRKIIDIIGLNRSLHSVARIDQHRYYGWLNYFKESNNISIVDISKFVKAKVNGLKSIGNYHRNILEAHHETK